jgi:LPXTG-motif cell wall-anchored protein
VNLVRPPVNPVVRRVATVAAAVLIGTLATFALATPASAHQSTISAEAACDNGTGTYKITWTVTNSQNMPETLLQVVFAPSGSGGPITTNATVPGHTSTNPGNLIGVQTVPGTTTLVSLTVQGYWDYDHYTESPKTQPQRLGGDCRQYQPKPHASATSACDGSVVVTVNNDSTATTTAAFKITGAGGFTQTTPAIKAGDKLDVAVPAANASSISVVAGTTNLGSFPWEKPKDCAPVKLSSKSDCTSLTVELQNPAGNSTVTATVSSGSNAPQTLTLAGGETKSATFAASAGTTATVTYGAGAAAAAKVAAAAAADATTPILVPWAAPAAPACAAPNLPVTGTKIGGIVLSGFAMLVLGAGALLYLRRRRRTVPTA